jgi:hypothetical protein
MVTARCGAGMFFLVPVVSSGMPLPPLLRRWQE